MIYHCTGSLFPIAHQPLKFAQLYFYDPDDTLQWCMNHNEHLDQSVMHQPQKYVITL
jgi:hypothetical protein